MGLLDWAWDLWLGFDTIKVGPLEPWDLRPGYVYVFTEPELFRNPCGEIPLRTELAILGSDNPNQVTLGWTVTEYIGVGVKANPDRVRSWGRGGAGRPVRVD